MNRKERRELKRLRTNTTPPVPPPPNQEVHRVNNCQPTTTRKIFGWFGNGLAVLAAVGLFYDFSPKIAVSSYTPLNLSDAFSAPFIIANDGYLPLRFASVVCMVKEVRFKDGMTFKNSTVAADVDIANSIGPAEKWTVKCRFSESITSSGHLEKADIHISIDFRTYTSPFIRNSQFRFLVAEASDGSWHWLPQPINK